MKTRNYQEIIRYYCNNNKSNEDFFFLFFFFNNCQGLTNPDMTTTIFSVCHRFCAFWKRVSEALGDSAGQPHVPSA